MRHLDLGLDLDLEMRHHHENLIPMRHLDLDLDLEMRHQHGNLIPVRHLDLDLLMRHLGLYLKMRSHHEIHRQDVQENQELVREQTPQLHCQRHHEQAAVEELERVELLAWLQDPRSAWRNRAGQTPLRQWCVGPPRDFV